VDINKIINLLQNKNVELLNINMCFLRDYNNDNYFRISISKINKDKIKKGFLIDLQGGILLLGYNIIDVLDKAIDIAHKRKRLYTEISNQKNQPPAVRIIAKVLADTVDTTFLYYEKLKKEVKDKEIEVIDFFIYDKISFLISQFNLRIHDADIKTSKELISFSLNFESEILALFLDIQGRLIKTAADANSSTYLILSDMIQTKTKLIHNLENLK
jgi:hypothetical protein